MERKVSVSKDIAATPEQVWSLITDLPSMGRWSPENDGGDWIRGASGPALGAKFRGKNSWEGKSWKAPVTITEFDAPHRFTFEMRIMPLGGADWSFDIEPTESGCKVTQTWIEKETALLRKIGTIATGVPERMSHTEMSMRITLDNLAKELEAQ